MEDFNMIPGMQYNVSSYFGCYQGTAENVYDGENPSALWKSLSSRNCEDWDNDCKKEVAAAGFLGCKKGAQSETGTLDYSTWDAATKTYVDKSKAD